MKRRIHIGPFGILRLAVAALLGCYVLLYPGSLVLVALDRVPVWGTWMGGALLILQGSLMGLWLSANFGARGALASLLILALSWLVEHIGASTGFPFGPYTYTEVLEPKILGVVPLAIPFAWLLIVPAAVGAAELFERAEGARALGVRTVLSAAAFALLLDVTIEPFAVHINRYWVWGASSANGYYGIPASNFVAWWATSLLLSWVLLRQRRAAVEAGPEPRRGGFWPWLPLALYLANLMMFVVVNLARGQAMAAAIGALVLLALACRWGAPRLAQLLRAAAARTP
jgi:putative membrane protein